MNTTDNTPRAGFRYINAVDQNNDGDYLDAGDVVGNVSSFDLGQPVIGAYADSATSQELEVELQGQGTFVYTEDIATSEITSTPLNPSFFANLPVDIEEETEAIDWYVGFVRK